MAYLKCTLSIKYRGAKLQNALTNHENRRNSFKGWMDGEVKFSQEHVDVSPIHAMRLIMTISVQAKGHQRLL